MVVDSGGDRYGRRREDDPLRQAHDLDSAFRVRGLRVTPQRRAIFAVLDRNEAHPSAESIHSAVLDEMPDVSLRTVYQTLSELTEMGEILSLDLGTGAARFDPNTDPHHHLVCERCGVIRDVEVPRADVVPSADHGFTIHGTEIVFRGLCPACDRTTPNRPVASHPPTQ